MTVAINPIGRVFGRLTVLEYRPGRRNPWKARTAYVVCECGNEKWVDYASLMNGHTSSCGCYRREVTKKTFTKHGYRSSKVYHQWSDMIDRCENKNNSFYHRYGARGIKVCKRWRTSFSNFLADMGEPELGMTLDRKNNNKGYSPSNCRWATQTEQARNRSSNVRVYIDGEWLCATEVAERYEVNPEALRLRLAKGVNPLKAIQQIKEYQTART